MKKLLLCICVSVLLSACSHNVQQDVTNEWWNSVIKKPGTKNYDPPNGDWIFINNEPWVGIDTILTYVEEMLLLSD